MAVNKVNTKACKKATSNSNKLINTVNATLNGETAKPNPGFIAPKINIKLKNTSITMWPAVMLANNRMTNTNGLINIPATSRGVKINNIGLGTPGMAKICFQ